jgi:hypothetical protein
MLVSAANGGAYHFVTEAEALPDKRSGLSRQQGLLTQLPAQAYSAKHTSSARNAATLLTGCGVLGALTVAREPAAE